MSDLEQLTGAPDAGDLLPDHTLSPFGLTEFGMLEGEFERLHITTAGMAALEVPDDSIRKMIIEAATADVKNGGFCYGSQGFDAQCLKLDNLALLLYVNLRITDPKMTKAKARSLLTIDNRVQVHRRVIQLLGFKPNPPKKTGEGDEEKDQKDAPTGPQSSSISESAAA